MGVCRRTEKCRDTTNLQMGISWEDHRIYIIYIYIHSNPPKRCCHSCFQDGSSMMKLRPDFFWWVFNFLASFWGSHAGNNIGFMEIGSLGI